jgi:hypothetical protein
MTKDVKGLMKTYLIFEIEGWDGGHHFETAYLTAYKGEEAAELNIKLSYNQVEKIISILSNVTTSNTFKEAWMSEVILGDGWGLIIEENEDDGDVTMGGR